MAIYASKIGNHDIFAKRAEQTKTGVNLDTKFSTIDNAITQLQGAIPPSATAQNPLVTQDDLETAIGTVGSFEVVSLTTGENPVPDVDDPSVKVIYLTKEPGSTKKDPYTEWIWSSGVWEVIGETTVDLSNYATTETVSYKADKVQGAVSGNFASLDGNGNLTDSGYKAANFAPADVADGKIDLIQNPVNGNIPLIDANGGLKDSGETVASFATAAQGGKADTAIQGVKLNGTDVTPDVNQVVDILVDTTDKADKVSGATNGDFAGLDSNGNLTDSGFDSSDFATSAQGTLADSSIQGVTVNGNPVTPDANNVVHLTVGGDTSGKADKVSGATAGDFAGLDASGNLTDSGFDSSDFATAAQGTLADSSIQGVKLNGTAITPDANNVVDVLVDTSDKTDKVSGATAGDLAGLDANGNLTDSGAKVSDFATSAQGTLADSSIQGVTVNGNPVTPDANNVVHLTVGGDTSGKADKVSGATAGDFAGLDANGNLTDSGFDSSDFATAAQGTLAASAIQGVQLNGNTITPDASNFVNVQVDISGKADKVANASSGNFAGLDSNGNLTDSGCASTSFATTAQGSKADSAVQGVSLNGHQYSQGTNNIVDIAATTLSAYGITDAYISSSTITLGGNSVSPVTQIQINGGTTFMPSDGLVNIVANTLADYGINDVYISGNTITVGADSLTVVSDAIPAVSGAVAGHVPELTNNGTLSDSGVSLSDLATTTDLNGKMGVAQNYTQDHFLTMDGNGNALDSGYSASNFFAVPPGAQTGDYMRMGASGVEWGEIPVAVATGEQGATDGLLTASGKSKLDGIETGAEVNVIDSISVNGTAQTITNKNVDLTITAPNDGVLTLTVGSASPQTFSADQASSAPVSVTVPLASVDTSGATPVYNEGLMSSAMVEKLDGIPAGATKVESSLTNGNIKVDNVETNVYTHPTDAGNKHIPAGGSSGDYLQWSAAGTATWGTIPTAVAGTSDGLMSSTDKSKLDGIAAGADVNVIEAITIDGGSALPVSSKTVDIDLSGKVDKVTGKGLSTNDYTAADKAVVDNAADVIPSDATDQNQLVSTSTMNAALANFGGFKVSTATGADNHPDEANPSTRIIYLIKDTSATGSDKYFEWICTDTTTTPVTWELIGDTSVDLSGYVEYPASHTDTHIVAFGPGNTIVDTGSTVASLQNSVESVSIDGTTYTPTSSTTNIAIPLAANSNGTGTAGAMSGADKVKLDGITAGATPNTVNTISIGNGSQISPTSGTTNIVIPLAANSSGTTSDGAMSGADKAKLDGIETGAEVNVQSDWSVTNSALDSYIANKPDIIIPLASPAALGGYAAATNLMVVNAMPASANIDPTTIYLVRENV